MTANVKKQAVKLRKEGKTYSEIIKILGINIPKSTISYWCGSIRLPADYPQKIREINLSVLNKARTYAVRAKHIVRLDEIKSIHEENFHLIKLLDNKDVAKIALAMLYLGEGMKNRKRGSLMLGNSDPTTICLFLGLLRKVYGIDERKFRCTLQCRADQDVRGLEKFWSNVTKIPLNQFYKAQVDRRTVGKPSKKADYKGVCRIDYFSAKTFAELLEIPQILHKGPVV